jgi:hypothetical protein
VAWAPSPPALLAHLHASGLSWAQDLGNLLIPSRGAPTAGNLSRLLSHSASLLGSSWEERARWTPATMTAWRFGRLRKATYGNVPLIVRWLAQDLVTTLPPPMACCSSLETEVTPTHAAPKIPERRKGGTVNIIPGFLACASSC